MNESIIPLLCQKNDISYLLFDREFKIVEFGENIVTIADDKSSLAIGRDAREAFWSLTGIESEIPKLFNNSEQESTIKIPMFHKNNAYYDLEIERCHIKESQELLITYFSRKSDFSINYANMIQEINKKTLIFQTNEPAQKKKEEYNNLINQRLLTFNVDSQGIISQLNKTCSFFFGLDEKEILGRHFSNFFETRKSSLDDSTSKIMHARNSEGKHIFFHANIIPLSKNSQVYENIIICQDISYLKEIEENLAFAAKHDSLTGLVNRSSLLGKIDEAISRGYKSDDTFALCLINFNNFKTVNKDYGHHAGDMLLKHLSNILTHLVREYDTVSRVGGDEFMILFDHIQNKEYLASTIQRIQETTQKSPLFYSEEDTIALNFSLSVSSYPDNGTSSNALMQEAYLEMKKVKKNIKETYK